MRKTIVAALVLGSLPFLSAQAGAIPQAKSIEQAEQTGALKVHDWNDDWHNRWRSHHRWGSHGGWGGWHGGWGWHNRWRSHYRWGSHGWGGGWGHRDHDWDRDRYHHYRY